MGLYDSLYDRHIIKDKMVENRGEKFIFSNQNFNKNNKVSQMINEFKKKKKEQDLLNLNFKDFIEKEEEIELSLKNYLI